MAHKIHPTVGYGSPPAEHRFQKGTSGNPKGRPRKLRPAASPIDGSLATMLIAEAQRPVNVVHNGRKTTATTAQVIIRRIAAAAANGDHRAQRMFLEGLAAAQESAVDPIQKNFEISLHYKMHFEIHRTEFEHPGSRLPNLLPHPDDIAINSRTREVVLNGPLDEWEKAAWDGARKLSDQARAELNQIKKSRVVTQDSELVDIDEEIEHREWIIGIVDSYFPDKATRRRPDFHIWEWRKQQNHHDEIQEILRKEKLRRKLAGLTPPS